MRLKYWEWIYALSFCCFQFQLIAVAQITDPAEVSALMAIKSNLVDPLKHLKNWNKGDPCVSNWTGVLCFDAVRTDGYLHVRELQLLNMNLSGTLAPELGQFSQLEILDFMWNDLRGSIPKEIGNIASLKLILLNGNNLSGPLPAELGYLSNLNRLQIDQNNISGTIPESFSNLNSVRHIHLNNNSLSGQIPPQLSNLSTLLHMLLDNNNLTGYLPPEFSNFPELRILQLDNNNFSGAEIPTSYGSLSALVKLSLRNCSLEGAVPDLSGIANLSYLDLSQNQLSGYIPSNPLSPSMTTIELSNNQLNGSIPDSYSDLPSLQKLSLKNNNLTGSVAAKIWQNKSFGAKAQLLLDLQNNSLSNITGNLNPLENVILRLQGNPICSTSNIRNKDQICGPEAGGDDIAQKSTNSTMICPIHACPIDNNFEYVPASPLPCFCASPLRIGYRLKSPSFSYFAPYVYQFEMYLTRSLNLDLYQLSIESFVWEKGPRLGMYLKLFPLERNLHSSIFNTTEIIRIRDIFTSWKFPGSDLFGPYELLNFTLGPYSFVNHETQVKNISKGILIAIVLPAIAVAATISALLTLFIARRKARNRHTLSRKHFSSKLYIKIDGVKSFSFREMELATDHFDSSTQVGQGGYGNVYRGILADDTIVAIKRAKEGSLQGQKEFLTEIEMLSRLHHRNLVSLVGYCDEEGEQMLVYEFMTNGSLQDWLSAKSKGTLNFGVRLQVALGSAKGILYLHTEVHPPIFHRDIKASNILLDSKLTAKVSDFGLSQLAPVMDDEGTEPVNVSTIVKGTPGYLDPEYLLTRKVTDKSDVYSLGVVFLEILTGMRPISHGKNIVREVNLAHESGTMFAVIDSRMGSYPSECVERFVALALRCCQDKPEQRPSMLDVVRELENILRMMPETGLDLSVSESSYFGESTPSSSLAFVSRDPVSSSNMLGSDLVSGSIPSIIPR
ncbi:probable LRR receptor-like serine/threonine-protein kinase At1g06840 isoform X1 [Rhododendron vialii]|uniref:probable LRR receptor-like serine/threonine-protein kinase At1g06840 isoform X1 n=1 Tax=Rhododendron vialii TaxID=182163 RepID=UPI00265E6DEA|nr:probable LRR receptor-like serine/threonine-protein kinase At1g06840 isoform X1 [Rhododendron vialii]XP_058214807.1 probable LRR receptor-like serine/threonine-protein kinase At1g06840 isoform X1 [Rhododendron vialii]XP_058214808.1 probable LRR receptor-like serine/threonine-protein kinase At1g06840 isoform X1 [Rhododendron vialii]XP_058214809.1 probable LRR receptor-like serine/threonine-protein kinase At1g06840 isoform X1 [Rhododendron vialii]XP_058214810.1 probable LRR receptor-like serin